MRFLIIRILIPLILFLVLRAVLRTIFSGSKSSDIAGNQDANLKASSADGVLKKDPVCGTYVAASTGITHHTHGETVYFCSKECRDKYRAA
jgi:YHS domain-containing protein